MLSSILLINKNRREYMTTEELKNLSWKKYIASSHWKKFRKIILDDINACCEICGKKRWEIYKVGKRKGQKKSKPTMQFHIHHLHYNKLGKESREDVMCLCSSCHSTIHDIEMLSRTRKGIYEKLYNIILKETNWRYTPFKKSK